jgi:hypothetical protein
VLARTLSAYTVTPAVVSPNGDGRNEAVTVTFNLSVPAFAKLEALKAGKPLVRPAFRPLPAGPQSLTWKAGVRDGDYDLALTITDVTGPVTQIVKVRVDAHAPRLARVRGRLLRLSLNEPARVTVIADGAPFSFRRAKAGTFRLVLGRPAKRLTVFATDAAGNVSRRLKLR